MLQYNAPASGLGGPHSASTVDQGDSANNEQLRSFYWLRKAIIHARKDQYFMPLASVENMPKHFGKTMKVHEYVPLLDDGNINNQGINAAGAHVSYGNLYGSAKDIGTITSRLPTLTENGGRVNRVGFTRIIREGSLQKMGMFYEFTKESLDFDSDDGLRDHLSRELMNGATQLTEAMLQIDLLESVETIRYAGGASSRSELAGEDQTIGGVNVGPTVVNYDDLMALDQMLTDNRTPKQTTVITGSRYIDTRVVPAGRIMYVGGEVVPHIRKMKDPFANPAFIPVQHYADAGNLLNGEIGTLYNFRIIEVPEMLHWESGDVATEGGTYNAGNDQGYRNDGTKYNVYPMLVVGANSFSTIGFQTNGKTVKFNVTTKMPGTETADRNDPYGETGFSSIKWYYGFICKRPERIAAILTVAPVA